MKVMNYKWAISIVLSMGCLTMGVVSTVQADEEAAVNMRIRPVVTLNDINIAGRVKPVEMAEKTEIVAEAGSTDAVDLGAKLYGAACGACHDTGAAGAPIVGNKGVWSARIAKGVDVLVGSATNGKGAMPPKGGQMHLTDDDIKALVAYMVEQSS